MFYTGFRIANVYLGMWDDPHVPAIYQAWIAAKRVLAAQPPLEKAELPRPFQSTERLILVQIECLARRLLAATARQGRPILAARHLNRGIDALDQFRKQVLAQTRIN